MRAGDLVRFTPTGEELLVAYAEGDDVSVHAVEPHDAFLARWEATLTDASRGTPAPRRIQHEHVPVHEAWPTRRWEGEGGEERSAPLELVVHAADCQLVREATDEQHARMLSVYAGLPEVSAPCGACEVRAANELPEQTEPGLVKCDACGGTGLEPQRRDQIAQNRCARCGGAGKVTGTVTVPCSACGGTELEAVDRRPSRCARQLEAHLAGLGGAK